jgi:hypothetical protein
MVDFRGLIVALSVVVSSFCWRAPAAAAAIPREVEVGLQRSAKALSPITLHWERRRRSSHALDELLPKIGYPPTSHEVLEPEFVEFKWNAPMFWESTDLCVIGFDRSKSPPRPVPSRLVITRSFDGDYWYEGQPPDPPQTPFGRHDGNLDVHMLEWLRSTRPDAMPVRREYLRFAGYSLPSNLDELGSDAKSLVLRCAAPRDNESRVICRELDSHRWEIECPADASGTYRFVVDRSLGYAIVSQSERDADGRLLLDVECSEFAQVAERPLWLPRICEVANYTWETNPRHIETEPLIQQEYILTAVEPTELSQADFKLRIDIPGTYVADASLPGARNQPDKHLRYTIPANPKQLDDAIKAAQSGGATPPSRLVWRLLLINACVIMLIIGISRIFRKRFWTK